MTELSITLNVKEVVDKISSKKDKWIKNIKNEMVQVAGYMDLKTKESIGRGINAPMAVDTGRFKGSVTGKAKELEATISSAVEYAKDVEYGTSRMNERPHFRNTLKKEKKKIVDFIKNALKR